MKPVALALVLLLPCLAVGADVDRAKAIGNPSAPLRLDLYSDFQCPHCKMLHETVLPAILRDYVATGKAYLVSREFPLNGHPYAREAAGYATAAARIGKYQPVGCHLPEPEFLGHDRQGLGYCGRRPLRRRPEEGAGARQGSLGPCRSAARCGRRHGRARQPDADHDHHPRHEADALVVLDGLQLVQRLPRRNARREELGSTMKLLSVTLVCVTLAAAADADKGKALGYPAAPILVEMYSDFQCPHCKHLHETFLPGFIKDYVDTGKVYFICREFPLPGFGARSREAAAY